MDKVRILDHPLLHHKLSFLRDKDSAPAVFRANAEAATVLLASEVTRLLPTETVAVETPLATAQCQRVREEDVTIVPILRAGLGMVQGFLDLMPGARVGHVGLARNEETHEPEAYYFKMPPGFGRGLTIVVDPMLATGGSACDAIATLKRHGAARIVFVCLIASEQGIARLTAEHPDVDVFVGECDAVLNDRAYIVPGVGDAGDRIFGTEN
ncbi:MAG: uracil phosphoribosyltransferase [Peptococcaceae bacterium]|nr:uracil phosphoribosyltransferase [Peptococcaceae bacterium]